MWLKNHFFCRRYLCKEVKHPAHDINRAVANLIYFQKGILMKYNNLNRQSGYSAERAESIIRPMKSIQSLSTEPEIQQKFEDKKPTGEIISYKSWFSQEGLPPFEVKFEKPIELPPYGTLVKFVNLQATEYKNSIYFKADGIKEAKS